MLTNRPLYRFCVRRVRSNESFVFSCADLDQARSFAERFSDFLEIPFAVYLTSVYYG